MSTVSSFNTPNSQRQHQLTVWLNSVADQHCIDINSISEASSDASFRRYYRVQSQAKEHPTLIIMDAPPPHEDCRPFVLIAERLKTTGLNVPSILEQDLSSGFLLLSDLGHQTYFQKLHTQPSSSDIHDMYLQALEALCRMQTASTEQLVDYNEAKLIDELGLFPEWYVKKLHQHELNDEEHHHVQQCFTTLAKANAAQKSVFVHRDFHSPNIMVSATGSPGILDFQDAVKGPITYDIVSLLMDARFTWDEEQQLDWAVRYWEMAKKAQLPVDSDFAMFHQAYEWMGLQRNLRILGVFARLNLRDNKAHYLQHIPRVNQYVRQVASRYEAFNPLMRLLDKLDQTEYTFSF